MVTSAMAPLRYPGSDHSLGRATAADTPAQDPGDGSAGGAAGATGTEEDSQIEEASELREGPNSPQLCSMELAKATSKLATWEPMAFYVNPHVYMSIEVLI